MAPVSSTEWEAILKIVVMFMPIVEWVVAQIEKLFKGIKTGEEKKEMAMATLAPLIPDKEARSMLINSVVGLKNVTGEFTHSKTLVG
jgi:hypothetical protein